MRVGESSKGPRWNPLDIRRRGGAYGVAGPRAASRRQDELHRKRRVVVTGGQRDPLGRPGGIRRCRRLDARSERRPALVGLLREDGIRGIADRLHGQILDRLRADGPTQLLVRSPGLRRPHAAESVGRGPVGRRRLVGLQVQAARLFVGAARDPSSQRPLRPQPLVRVSAARSLLRVRRLARDHADAVEACNRARRRRSARGRRPPGTLESAGQ
jgi:hypothetical protein